MHKTQQISAGFQPDSSPLAANHLLRIPHNRNELQAIAEDKRLKLPMSGQPNMMTGPLQPQAQSHIRLDIPARTNGDYGDVHPLVPPSQYQGDSIVLSSSRLTNFETRAG
jgi:hypothetical protein